MQYQHQERDREAANIHARGFDTAAHTQEKGRM